MILFKCKCGCFFSVKDDIPLGGEYRDLLCQNCDNGISVSKNRNLAYIAKNLTDSGFSSVQLIPDDAQIEVKYTL